MINVTHIRSTIGFYGAEKVVFNLFSNIEYSDISLSLITLENGSEPSSFLRDKISRLSFMTKKYQLTKKYDRRVIDSIRLQFSRNETDVVHTHDYKSLFYALSASRDLALPVIHHMHGYLNNTVSEALYAWLEKYLINRVKIVFVVSRDLKKRLERSFLVRNKAVRFLANGTQLASSDEVNRINDTDFTNISMIARLTSEKNHLLALEAVKKLKERTPKVKLNLYGDGPCKEKIIHFIKFYNLSQYVEVHGYREDITEIFGTTDILLVTSLTEGLPMVILEAMSHGIAIVSTDVGQIAEVLDNEKCGMLTLFDPNDISNKLFQLLTNKTKLKKLGENAKDRVDKDYSISSQIDVICNAYREIV